VGTGVAAAALALGWLLFIGIPRWYAPPATVSAEPATVSDAPLEAGRKIKARLFYVSDDGTRLTSVEHEVAYADSTVAQARYIVEAQLAPVAPPLVSAIPTGTTLRAIFLTEQGAAYVDLSREITSAHPGGSLNELLTVYTVVQALTTNLPAVTSVQVLVEGQEIDTLAGHVDVKRRLSRSDEWVADATPR
jgi:spore germination protein GerM